MEKNFYYSREYGKVKEMHKSLDKVRNEIENKPGIKISTYQNPTTSERSSSAVRFIEGKIEDSEFRIEIKKGRYLPMSATHAGVISLEGDEYNKGMKSLREIIENLK